MSENVKPSTEPWVDPDDAPPLDDEWFETADVYHGDKLIRRGRAPRLDVQLDVSLRLDADILAKFRADGPGWQTRMNDALRKAAGL